MDQKQHRWQDGASEARPLYVSYAEEFQISEQHQLADETGILRRINHAIVYYLGAYFCNLDLQPDRPEPEPVAEYGENDVIANDQLYASEFPETKQSRQSKQAWLVRCINLPLVQSKWKRQLRFGWIPRVILACYLTLVAYMLVTLYYQYSYDFGLLRMRKLGELGRLGNISFLHTEITKAELVERMSHTKEILNFLGPNYSHLTILVECFYLCIVILVTLIYLGPFMHYRFQRAFDYHIIRDLLDRRRENANIRRLVERQVAKFIESSRVYHENQLNFDNLLGFPEVNFEFSSVVGSNVLKGQNSASGSVVTFSCEHELNQMVREMLASGALTPLFKLPAWIMRRTNLQFAYHMALLLYAVLFDISFTMAFLAQADPDRLASASSRSLIQFALVGLLTIAAPSVVLHAPIFMLVLLEQLNYVQQLRAMTKKCILENLRAFAQHSGRELSVVALERSTRSMWDFKIGEIFGQVHARRRGVIKSEKTQVNGGSKRRASTGHERIVNSNLIFLILHYKIFVAQLLPIKRSMAFVNIIALTLLFTLPIIARIHAPYISQLYDANNWSSAQLKIFTILISSSVLLPANLISAPLCIMLVRCKGLYCDLASLMAHISEFKSYSPGAVRSSCANIYDSHAESCLLKELSDAAGLLEQLTVRMGGISGSYTVLVKAHFWYGLIAISNLSDSNDGQSYTGSGELLSWLLSDPLGVYSQVKN